MRLRTAELIKGTEQRLNEGATAPIKAALRVDAQIVTGIVKTISLDKIAVECLCALVLRAWGVPVPEPVIVQGDSLMFGSLDVGYPNLKQKIGYSEALSQPQKDVLIKIGCDLVGQFQSTPLVIAADEAIGNFDRNLGNILWDGADVVYIDHERALGLSNDVDQNKLATMAMMSSNVENVKMAAIAIAQTLKYESIGAIDPLPIDVTNISEYIVNRISNLASKVLFRFPQPQDLLTGLIQ